MHAEYTFIYSSSYVQKADSEYCIYTTTCIQSSIKCHTFHVAIAVLCFSSVTIRICLTQELKQVTSLLFIIAFLPHYFPSICAELGLFWARNSFGIPELSAASSSHQSSNHFLVDDTFFFEKKHPNKIHNQFPDMRLVKPFKGFFSETTVGFIV